MGAGILYRPDIDGLRAVAIIPVVLFHVGITQFSGGFVGVDVFFVISGYLITCLIDADLRRGTFTITGFYDRRIRRILPALIAVLLFSLAMGWFTMLPDEMEALGRMTAASAAFVANVFLWRVGLGYFDLGAGHLPIMHLWSLAVEEQFYLVWPLLLAWLAPSRRRIVLMFFLFLSSLAISIWATRQHPVAAFYLFPSRAWELLAGALLALLGRDISAPRSARELLPAMGLGLIIFSIFAYDGTLRFPGEAALAPCLGAMLVIAFGKDSFVGRILALPPLVWIGLISYSLYLWHWPLLTFIEFVRGQRISGGWWAFVIITLSFAVAYLSWRYIEQPFRRRGAWAPSRSITFGAAALMILACGGIVLALAKGFPARLPADASMAIAGIESFEPVQIICTGDSLEAPLADPRCTKAPPGRKPRAILWGDSHAQHYVLTLRSFLEKDGFFFMGEHGCPPLIGIAPAFSPNGRADSACWYFNQAALRNIEARPEADIIFLAARWSLYTLSARAMAAVDSQPIIKNNFIGEPGRPNVTSDEALAIFPVALERTIRALGERRIVILLEVPSFGVNVPRCFARSRLMGQSANDCLLQDAPRNRAYRARVNVVIERVAARHPNVRIFAPDPYFCDAKNCRAHAEGRILYRDDNHLNKEGSAYLARAARAQLSDYQ